MVTERNMPTPQPDIVRIAPALQAGPNRLLAGIVAGKLRLL